jgi:soluble lytic murein transglycosylase-like protein
MRRRGAATMLALFLFVAASAKVGDPAIALEASSAEPDASERPQGRERILEIVLHYRRSARTESLEALADAIYDESVRAAVDPLLVASIVATESSFRHTVVSSTGAVGLMQIRPWVAGELAGRLNLDWSGPEALHTPSINMRLGILYYKDLMDRFGGDSAIALTAYNYGPSRVRRQLRDGTYSGSAYAAEVLSLYGRLTSGGGNV